MIRFFKTFIFATLGLMALFAALLGAMHGYAWVFLTYGTSTLSQVVIYASTMSVLAGLLVAFLRFTIENSDAIDRGFKKLSKKED